MTRCGTTSEVVQYKNYNYDNLTNGEIRIIDILPKTRNDGGKVRLRMRKTVLDNPEPYIALSYTWGKTFDDGSHLSKYVEIDGINVRVTSNLYTAIQRLRTVFNKYEGLPQRPLWADALCINQGNLHEQGHQVKRMGEIYRKADQLLVWLGEGFTEFDPSTFRPVNGSFLPSTASAVEKMLRSPWFQRRWVIQEYYMKKSERVSLLLRSSVLDGKIFAEILHRHSLDRDLRLLTKASVKTEPGPLLDNLVDFGLAECSDGRDYVYSLLSISSDGSDIEVDYSKDTLQVYLEVAQHLYRRIVTLWDFQELLLHAVNRKPKPNSPDWPSWVPDWRSSGNFSPKHYLVDKKSMSRPLLPQHRPQLITQSTPPAHGLVLNVVLMNKALRWKDRTFPPESDLNYYCEEFPRKNSRIWFMTPRVGCFCRIPKTKYVFHLLPTSCRFVDSSVPCFKLNDCVDPHTIRLGSVSGLSDSDEIEEMIAARKQQIVLV